MDHRHRPQGHHGGGGGHPPHHRGGHHPPPPPHPSGRPPSHHQPPPHPGGSGGGGEGHHSHQQQHHHPHPHHGHHPGQQQQQQPHPEGVPQRWHSFKMLVDPQIHRGAAKMVRYDGSIVPGNPHHIAPVPQDPRKKLPSALWKRLEPMDLPVPRLKARHLFSLFATLAVTSRFLPDRRELRRRAAQSGGDHREPERQRRQAVPAPDGCQIRHLRRDAHLLPPYEAKASRPSPTRV